VDWNDKTVVITGAASGIGAALAKELGERGASLGLMDVQEEELVSLVEEMEPEDESVLTMRVDVTDEGQVSEEFDRVESEFGSVDVVVANAGIGYTTPANDLDGSAFKEIMDVNVQGVVNTVQAGLDDMLEATRGGKIVIVSSVLGFTPMKGGAGYCGSKTAVLRLGESLRLDLQDDPISVTTVHPGWVETEMTREYSEKFRLFEVSAETAARTIREGIEADRDYVVFPWAMKVLFKLVDWTPWGLLDWIRAQIPKIEKQ
jgi:short-subunit dehydrogenase